MEDLYNSGSYCSFSTYEPSGIRMGKERSVETAVDRSEWSVVKKQSAERRAVSRKKSG